MTASKHLIVLVLCMFFPVFPLLAAPSRENRKQPAVGDSRILAMVPSEGTDSKGFPEGLATNGNRIYVGTAATFGTAGSGPSRIYVYNRDDGERLGTYKITGEDLSHEHGLSGMTFDSVGRLYVLSTQLGVLRLVPGPDGAWSQTVYASIPDLLPCGWVPPGTACSPTPFDRPPLPNDIAFDTCGNAYVTDSFQATVWRIRPGSQVAEPWLQDARLDGSFGPNGLRLSPDQKSLYIAQTVAGYEAGAPGYIYRLPVRTQVSFDDLQLVAMYPYEAPDGITFGASGRLYVALAASNEISVLDPDGTEVMRLQGSAQSRGSWGSPIPWDAPASLVFNNRKGTLLATNHALLSGVASHFAVFEVYVADRAAEPPWIYVP